MSHAILSVDLELIKRIIDAKLPVYMINPSVDTNLLR